MKSFAILCTALMLSLGCAASGSGQEAAPPSFVAAAVNSPNRPKADTDRDAARKPAELVAFAGLKPGQRAADLMPGGGYFTRIFSAVVGPAGHVYAIIPSELAQVAPKMVPGMQVLAAEPGYGNVSVLTQPTADLSTPEAVDFAWTSDNYHDLYGFFGAEQAAAFDRAVFKMLKPGGVFIVIDHAAASGAPDTSAKTLHRIAPSIVEGQVLAAGFVLEARSDLLRNPADDHQLVIFAPPIRGHTDQFVLKFRKPRA